MINDEHWADTRFWLAKISDAEVQDVIDSACDEDWEHLREEGIDLNDTHIYSTAHRLCFALEEREARAIETSHEKVCRLAKLAELVDSKNTSPVS